MEEHFYLFFPFLFLALIRTKKALVAITALLIVISLFLRLYTIHAYGENYFSETATYSLTHNRFDSILFGCLLSMLINSPKKEAFLKFTAHPFIYGVALAMLLFTLLYRDEFFRNTFRYSVQGISFLVLVPPIVYCASHYQLNRILSGSILVLIGKMSYSIYLFHHVAAFVFTQLDFKKGSLPWITGNVVLTLVLAWASYYGVEQRFVHLRKKFGSNLNAEEKAPKVKTLEAMPMQAVA